jgi:hypothetical protein
MSTRVKMGFHRLGTIGLVPLEAAAVMALLFAAYTLLTSADGLRDALSLAGLGLAFLAVGGAWYGICWALGWVITGFLGDDK